MRTAHMDLQADTLLAEPDLESGIDVDVEMEFEAEVIERRFSERAVRLGTLIDLDRVLSAAANRHNLAAQIVHYGWPHRAD